MHVARLYTGPSCDAPVRHLRSKIEGDLNGHPQQVRESLLTKCRIEGISNDLAYIAVKVQTKTTLSFSNIIHRSSQTLTGQFLFCFLP